MIFEAYTGTVESVLVSSDDEILRDLVAVAEATFDREFRLTKGGLPPKPLWTAINDRLLWKDPKSILDDWDEVDQVRFIYGLALQLGILQSDMDRNLSLGVGADRFFFASATRRAAMLQKAWLDLEDWDERCDARNDYGHRYHFGQTFRRDFRHTASALRAAVLSTLDDLPAGSWYRSDKLAQRLYEESPGLFVAEDDGVGLGSEVDPEEEFQRFVEYWLYQAARFGWVNLSRIGDDADSLGVRLFSLTDLFVRVRDGEFDEAEEPWRQLQPYRIGNAGEVKFRRAGTDVGDEYFLRRISDVDAMPDWDEEVATFLVTPESLERAARSWLSMDAAKERFESRLEKKMPARFKSMWDEAFGNKPELRVSMGVTAVELFGFDADELQAVSDLGFTVIGLIALVPWDRWAEFSARFGEANEGFDYPTHEALGHVHKSAIELVWPVLPMAGRDLLLALDVQGDPLSAPLSEGIVETLGAGWTQKSVAEALRVVTDDDLPPWLLRHLPT